MIHTTSIFTWTKSVGEGGVGPWEWTKIWGPKIRHFLVLFNYRPQRSWGKVMFLHVSVILSTGEGCLLPGGVWSQGSLVLGGSGPRGVPDGDPPQWLLLRAVHILLECILVLKIDSTLRNKCWSSLDIGDKSNILIQFSYLSHSLGFML